VIDAPRAASRRAEIVGSHMERPILVLTTLAADADAEVFARTLVDERLAACVNILAPMQSVYRWQGQVEHASERQLMIKTLPSRLAVLKTRLADLHPYQVPELLVLPITDGGEAYLRWVGESVSDAP
jgi:periplasmic divalent cation tolerance protein